MATYNMALDFAVNHTLVKGVVARLGDKEVTVELIPYLNNKPLDITSGVFTLKATTPSNKVVSTTGSVVDGHLIFTLDNHFILEKGAYPNAYFTYETPEVNYSTQNFHLVAIPLADITKEQGDYYLAQLEQLIQTFNDRFDDFMRTLNEDVTNVNNSLTNATTQLSQLKEQLIELKTQIEVVGRFKLKYSNDIDLSIQPDPNTNTTKYRGMSLVDSDDNTQYVWDLSPEYVEQNLATADVKQELVQQSTDYTDQQIDNVSTETKRYTSKYNRSLKWVAHRGNHNKYPENSIIAFENVYRHSCIETDIQLTSDNRWVVMHDETVDRTTNGTGKVSDMTYEAFRKLRIDTGGDIGTMTDVEKTPPNLEEFLLICKKKNKTPVVEIKASGGYTNEQLQLIRTMTDKLGVTKHIVFISFNYETLQQLRLIFPNNEIQYLLSSTISDDIIQNVINLGYPSGLSSSYNNQSLTQDVVNKLHQNNCTVATWTVPESDFTRLENLGIDYITTDSQSGELKYSEITLLNDFTPTVDSGVVPQYVEQLADGAIHLSFNVKGGNSNNQYTMIGQLPEWAIPSNKQYNSCMVRTSSGAALATFDIQGRNPTINTNPGSITIGLGWSVRTTWGAGHCVYKVD